MLRSDEGGKGKGKKKASKKRAADNSSDEENEGDYKKQFPRKKRK